MPQTTGLLASVKTLTGSLLAVAQTRLELLANEMEEDKLRMARILFFSLLAFFFICLGMMLITLLIIVVFWDTYRMLTIGLIVAVYLGIAAGLAVYAVREFKRKPKIFSSSLAEFIKDRALLEDE
ncbi:MAG: phage holin family protein [Methylophilaceae bacterium]